MTLEADIQNAINKGIVKAAIDMWSYSKRICPVDTGRLRNSIKFHIEEGNIVIRADADYASFVEYGTERMVSAHGEHDPERPVTDWKALRKRGGSGQMMPFIRPAIFLGIRQFIPKRIKEELMKL